VAATGSLTGSAAAGERDFPEVPEQGGDTPWLTAKHPDERVPQQSLSLSWAA